MVSAVRWAVMRAAEIWRSVAVTGNMPLSSPPAALSWLIKSAFCTVSSSMVCSAFSMNASTSGGL